MFWICLDNTPGPSLQFIIATRKQRSKRKSSKISVTNSILGVAASKDPPQTKPLLKADILKKSGPFLWNSGGKKVQFPKDVSPPKTMVIDGVTIYIQLLTSEEAKACGVIGWDSVLADTKWFRPEIAERKIADFWANWRHSRVMARRLRSQTHSNPTPGPSAEAVGSVNSLTGPSVEAGGSTNSNSSNTPSVDASKRKCTGTPGCAEPPTKKSSLVDGQAYSWVAGAIPATKKSPSHTLWVHTHDIARGPINKDVFFEIVSRCNVIKCKGAIRGEAEFSWNNNLKGQPTFDDEHSRGKNCLWKSTNS